jgi:cytoskeletal protein RodZ
MQGSGVRLKKVRLEKGITLEEAHKKTKIHLDILKALEEDSVVNLNPIYVKGFLKIYCNFLKVDPRDYITDYKEPATTAQIVKVVEKKVAEKEELPESFIKAPSRKSIFPSPATTKKIIRILFIAIIVITAVNILFNLGRMIAHRLTSRRAKASVGRVVKKEKKPLASKPEKSVVPTNEAKVDKQQVSKGNEITPGIRLAIRAKEDSWIQVKADRRTVFQNILKKGRSESWEAKDKIELSLGNAAGVDLEINSKLIPSLGRRGQVIKNILITKEGLSIKR